MRRTREEKTKTTDAISEEKRIERPTLDGVDPDSSLYI